MSETKKNGIMNKIGFNFGSKSEKEASVAVLEHDTFETSQTFTEEPKMSYED